MTCPVRSALKFPRKYISTGPITANTIRPTTVPSTRLSRNPSCTHRPLPNFCAILTPYNKLSRLHSDVRRRGRLRTTPKRTYQHRQQNKSASHPSLKVQSLSEKIPGEPGRAGWL